MRDDLLANYERELAFVRQLGAEFAVKYPKVASRLQLEPSQCQDPHVERLIEAFAFLAARVHLKIDDEFPELTQALLGILYPHYIRPVPSMSVVEFHLDPEQGQLTSGLKVKRDSVLLARKVNDYRCRFRTCYDLTLWPVSVAAAQWTSPERLDPPVKSPDSAWALRLQLQCGRGANFSNLGMSSLRFFLNGEPSVVYPLYEMLANSCLRILVRDLTPRSRLRPLVLPGRALRGLGFEEEEGLLPYPRRSFSGYRLLQEYFAFPEKFLFFDLNGLDPLRGSAFGEHIELVFLFAPCERSDWEPILQLGVAAKTFRLNATPVINLFPHSAEPVAVVPTKFEYQVVPDVRRHGMLEVFSIEEVIASKLQTPDTVRFEPFYSYRHAPGAGRNQLFFQPTRRASAQRFDEASELWITLVDLDGRTRVPDYDTLLVRCLCTNREVPSRLVFGNEEGDFDLENALPVQKIVALRKPTGTFRPALGSGALWRLISQLSLNYLSLVEEGREALQEILRLYSPLSAAGAERQIDGLAAIASRRHYARVTTEAGIAFVRGTRVEMLLDEEFFVGASAFLFAAVVDRFLGLYVSLNSFSQLEVRTRQRKELLRRWPARAGKGILL